MKIDRLISIVMLLLERKQISATKLAEMFEVTPRTIYRDVETISQAGIPIVAQPGVHGGIRILEEYKIAKKLFTVSDITALLIGLGSIHSSLSGEEILHAMAKVKGLIPPEQIRNIELKSNQIAVDHTPWLGDKKLRVNLEEIKLALRENRFITFQYSDQSGQKSQRKIEPYRLVLKYSNWYLQGYCTTREDFRTFRLSRISAPKLLEESFEPRAFDYGPLEVSDRLEKKKTPVKLLVDEKLLDILLEFCGEESIEPVENHKYMVHFPFVEDDFSYSMLLRFGDKCECLEPEHVRLELIRRIKSLLQVYEK